MLAASQYHLWELSTSRATILNWPAIGVFSDYNVKYEIVWIATTRETNIPTQALLQPCAPQPEYKFWVIWHLNT